MEASFFAARELARLLDEEGEWRCRVWSQGAALAAISQRLTSVCGSCSACMVSYGCFGGEQEACAPHLPVQACMHTGGGCYIV